MPPQTEQPEQCRVVCEYITTRDTRPLVKLRLTVGVKKAVPERTADGVAFIVTIDPKKDKEEVKNRLRKLAASWGEGPEGFPARVEDFETQGAGHD